MDWLLDLGYFGLFSRIIYCGHGRSVQLGCPTDRHAGSRGECVALCGSGHTR